MPAFPKTLRAWQTDDFDATLKKEIDELGINALPLTGYAAGGPITMRVLRAMDTDVAIQCHTGVWFTEILPCCGDPGVREKAAYCEVQIRIDKSTAAVVFLSLSN